MFSCFYQFLNQKISHFKKKKYYLLQLKLKIEKFSENTREIRKRTQFFNFRTEIKFSSWREKAMSRAEPSWKSFSSSYGSSQLGSESSLPPTVRFWLKREQWMKKAKVPNSNRLKIISAFLFQKNILVNLLRKGMRGL